MENINVYCPYCKNYNKGKLLCRVSTDFEGAIYAYCRRCKVELKITKEGENVNVHY
jgi:hypothetical protein